MLELGTSMKLSLGEMLYSKQLLRTRLEELLPDESTKRARSDYHSRKKPLPCGVTVHSVVGCTSRCVYCYIPDMGVSFSAAYPYGLSGLEMAYALLSNPYFLPGRGGSYIALGSIGEPFHPVGEGRTLEYIATFSRHLGNPIQFSTKMALSEETVSRLASTNNAPLSPLITIITLEKYELLEPGAPTPEERLETIRRLRRAGLHPILFFRPLMPGINFDGALEILKAAKDEGAVGVTIGGFRVTRTIIKRLVKAGFDTSAIMSRVRSRKIGLRQVGVFTRDLKEQLVLEARKLGLVPFLAACCANSYTAFLSDGTKIPCAGLDYIGGSFCTRCPLRCENIRIQVDPEEVTDSLRRIASSEEVLVEEVTDYKVFVRVGSKKVLNRLRDRGIRSMLETAYRRVFVVNEK